tara:strand:- start:125 stop:850 length:726 start_codon:yes stop_codon:yes gene_type:complete
MKTTEILSTQFKYINNNSQEFLKICLPYFLLMVLNFYIPENSLFDDLCSLVMYVVVTLMIVNIHRYMIIEDKNYYSFKERLKPTFRYACYGILLLVISFAPVGLFYASFLFFTLAASNILPESISLIIIGVSFLIMIFCMFLVYPSFALILPIAAIGEKVEVFKMWKLSKGFKLTIFLQFFIVWVVFLLILTPLYMWIGEGLLYNLFSSFLVLLAYILVISSLSKTYLLWKDERVSQLKSV